MKHSKTFPPSGSKFWLSCPAWEGVSDENLKGKFGTFCHDFAEKWLKTGDKPSCGFMEVDLAVENIVGSYVNYCLDAQEFAQDYLVEETLENAVTGEVGTMDFAHWFYLDGGTSCLEVVDLKTGKNFVSAKMNTQLMIYALSCADKFGVEPDVVSIVIWQRDKYRQFELLGSELMEWKEKFLGPKVGLREKVLTMAFEKQMKHIVPEFSACMFCAKSDVCYKGNADAVDDFELC